MENQEEKIHKSGDITNKRKRHNPIILIVIIVIVLFGLFYFISLTKAPGLDVLTISPSITEKSGEELGFMTCDEYKELNSAEQAEAIRKVYAHYKPRGIKLPIDDTKIQDEIKYVKKECRKKNYGPLPRKLRDALGIIQAHF